MDNGRFALSAVEDASQYKYGLRALLPASQNRKSLRLTGRDFDPAANDVDRVADGACACVLERQRLGLLDLRQLLHLGQHVRRHHAIDLDQRDGVAALAVAAEVEGGDVDLRIAQQ
jgi:hypothetical protein